MSVLIKKTVAVAAFVTLAGCAPKYAWQHRTNALEQVQRDLAECEYETSKAGLSIGRRGTYLDHLKNEGAKREVTKQCMELRGYTRVAAE